MFELQRDKQTDRDRQTETETDRDRQTETETEKLNSNSKTLLYKDCGFGLVKI